MNFIHVSVSLFRMNPSVSIELLDFGFFFFWISWKDALFVPYHHWQCRSILLNKTLSKFGIGFRDDRINKNKIKTVKVYIITIAYTFKWITYYLYKYTKKYYYTQAYVKVLAKRGARLNFRKQKNPENNLLNSAIIKWTKTKLIQKNYWKCWFMDDVSHVTILRCIIISYFKQNVYLNVSLWLVSYLIWNSKEHLTAFVWLVHILRDGKPYWFNWQENFLSILSNPLTN